MASHIGRRKFLATLSGGAAAWPLAALAQQAMMPVISVERNPRGQRALIVGPDAYLGGIMEETDSAREARLRELASRLLFTLSKEDSRFSLYRETDVPHPVRHDGLTLDGVEETLTTWKLRGPHGG